MIAAIFGQPDFSDLTLRINGSVFRYGAFFNAVISFLILAAVVYLAIVLPYNRLQERMARGEEDPVPPTEDVALLTEIRDLLAAQGRGH